MSSAAIWVVMAAVAVEFGYEPMPDGNGIRYVVQVEPEMLDILGRGEPVGSSIPPEALGLVREIRIVANYGPLSKEIPPVVDKPAASMPPSEPKWSALEPLKDGSGWEPGHLSNTDMVQQASASEETAGPSGVPRPIGEAREKPTTSKTPWLLLVLASVIAVGSSSGMFVFGWLAFDYRSRYLELLRESMETGKPWLDTATGEGDSAPSSLQRMELAPTSDATDAPSSADEPADDSAWEDLGVGSKDSVDDWLQDDGNPRNRSRGHRKKSR